MSLVTLPIASNPVNSIVLLSGVNAQKINAIADQFVQNAPEPISYPRALLSAGSELWCNRDMLESSDLPWSISSEWQKLRLW